MTNHVHLLITTNDEPLQHVMRDLKKHTAKELIKAIEENPKESRKDWMLWMFERAGKKNPNNKNHQFWQQHNQPIVLSNAYAFDQKIGYIHENPVKAGFVDYPEQYLYSSARDYADEKGLVKVLVAR